MPCLCISYNTVDYKRMPVNMLLSCNIMSLFTVFNRRVGQARAQRNMRTRCWIALSNGEATSLTLPMSMPLGNQRHLWVHGCRQGIVCLCFYEAHHCVAFIQKHVSTHYSIYTFQFHSFIHTSFASLMHCL